MRMVVLGLMVGALIALTAAVIGGQAGPTTDGIPVGISV